MMKATLRSAVLLGFLAWSVPSFAEVQNVKVGGEVTVRAFHRENLDLHDESNSASKGLDSRDNFLMQTTALNVGVDLTENVSGFVRLANERDWDSSTGEPNEVALSQAYVTLKELFYSPLTLKVGTQPIVWGRGFVLGSNLFPIVNSIGDDRNAAISANEFSDFIAFDSIRATLDLSGVAGLGMPLSADYVYIKLDENTVGQADDSTLQGVNLGTRFDAANSEFEIYYLNKRDQTGDSRHGSVSTWGLRGSAQPMEGAYLFAELAHQFGTIGVDPAGTIAAGEGVQAWGVDLGLEYTFANVATTPKLGFEWIFHSGKKRNGNIGRVGPNDGNGGATGGWVPIAPGYFTTALREFQTQSTVAGFYANDQPGVTSGGTNQHQFSLYGSFKPVEDLTVAPRLSWFVLDEGVFRIIAGDTNAGAGIGVGGKRKRFVGTEWDTVVTYDYTDDVQLGLIYGVFWPGNVYTTPTDATAQELVTSVSVKF